MVDNSHDLVQRVRLEYEEAHERYEELVGVPLEHGDLLWTIAEIESYEFKCQVLEMIDVQLELWRDDRW